MTFKIVLAEFTSKQSFKGHSGQRESLNKASDAVLNLFYPGSGFHCGCSTEIFGGGGGGWGVGSERYCYVPGERYLHPGPKQKLLKDHERDKFKKYVRVLEAKAERMLDAFHS